MKFKVREILDSIEEQDLYKLQADLEKGGIYLKKLVGDRLKQLENTKMRQCTTCGHDIADKQSTYTLLFGPEDFKKKASFCEMDCLEYFLAGLKKCTVKGDANGVQEHNQDL